MRRSSTISLGWRRRAWIIRRSRSTIGEVAVTGAIASGTVRTGGFAGRSRFEDRFHLLRDEGGWRITAKLFTTL